MKRFSALFLTFILIFNFIFVPFSYADTIEDLKNTEIGSGLTEMDSLKTPTQQQSQSSGAVELSPVGAASGLISVLIKVVTWPINLINMPLQWLIGVAPKIDGCIFNTEDTFKLSFFDANPVGLSGTLQGSISAIYNAFRYLVTAAYIVILVYLAVRMMLSSVGRQKAQYKELFRHWLIGLLILFSFHWIMAFIIWLSNTFVDILANLSSELLKDIPSGSAMAPIVIEDRIKNFPITHFIVSRAQGATEGLSTLSSVFSPIIAPILYVLLLASTFSIIMTYFKRLFTIAVLILVFPLVALSYVFDKIGDRKAQTLSLWLKEFMVNVMIQPIHAVILVFIALLYSSGLDGLQPGFGDNLFGANLLGAIMSLAALRLIPVGEDLLKKLFQINSSMGPGSQGIAGTMAKTGMALQGAKNIAGSLGKIGKSAATMRTLRKQNDLKNLKGKARDEAKAGGAGRFQAWRASNQALKDKNTEAGKAYQKYLEQLKEQTGSNSAKAVIGKTAAQVAAATAGAGFAITSANSGRFLSSAATNAAVGVEAVGALGKAGHAIWGDLKEYQDYENRAKKIDNLTDDQFKNLSEPEKQKICAELGIEMHQLNGLSKNTVADAYRSMGNAARWGAKSSNLKEFTSIHRNQKNIEKGLMPDGSKLDINKFDKSSIVRTKDGIYASVNGDRYKISSKGNPNLKDNEEESLNIDPSTSAILGTNVKDIMKIANNAEYKDLEKTQSDLKRDISTKSSEVSTLETNKKRAERDVQTAEKKLTSLIRNGASTTDIDNARAELATAENKQTEAQEKYTIANSSLTESRRKLRTVNSRMEKIEESTKQQYLEAEKVIMEMGGEPIFTETAYTAAQDSTKYPDAKLKIATGNAFIDLGNGQSYKIQDGLDSHLNIEASPAEFATEFATKFANVQQNAATTLKSELQPTIQAFHTAETNVTQKQNALNTAETNVTQKQNALNTAETNVTQKQNALDTAKANVTQKQNALNTAETNVTQKQFEFETAISESDIAIAQMELNIAVTARNTAQSDLDAAKSARGTAQSDLTAAESARDTARTELNNAVTARNTAQSDLTAAESARDTAKQNLDDKKQELNTTSTSPVFSLGSLQVFDTATREKLDQTMIPDVPSGDGFSYGTDINVASILDTYIDGSYQIILKRTSNTTLSYTICDISGNDIDNDTITIDPASFNCDALRNINDSVQIVSKVNTFGEKGWFIKS